MAVITVNLPDDQIHEADQIAAEMTADFGVPVSRSEIVRRALRAFFVTRRSNDRPEDAKETAEPVAA